MEGIEVEVQGADEGMEHTASKKVSSDSDLQEVWMMVNRRRQEKKKKHGHGVWFCRWAQHGWRPLVIEKMNIHTLY